jgi:transposase
MTAVATEALTAEQMVRIARDHVDAFSHGDWERLHAGLAADARYDGLSVLFTTAPRQYSGDELFTKFKEQNYIELLHHQMKTPLAVRPVFLKSPRRVEALVTLLQIALQAYQVLERCYRQTVPEDAPVGEQRMTAETLLRHFRVYGCIIKWENVVARS